MIRVEGKGPMLFDTAGFNERYVILEKLASFGVRPDDIESVFLSHFHFDHAVNFGMFPNAAFYLHEKEAQYVSAFGQEDLAVPYEMFPALADSGRLSLLSGNDGVVEGIRWIHTPGHTPGLYSLFLPYEGERWVLASDAVKNKAELATGHVAMSRDPASSYQSIETIRTWADVVVPGHDGLLRIIRDQGKTTILSVSKPSVEVIVPGGEEAPSKTLHLQI